MLILEFWQKDLINLAMKGVSYLQAVQVTHL